MASTINASTVSGIVQSADTSGVLALQTGGTTAVTVDASQNVTFTNNANLPNTFGFKNRLINGGMTIAQRTTSSVTADSGGSVYPVDRFRLYGNGGGVFTGVQSSTVPASGQFRNSTLLTVTTPDTSIASTDYYSMAQYIEGYNVADLMFGTSNAQSVTVSFWVNSSVTGTYSFAIHNSDASRYYIATYTVNSASTWEQKSVTIPGDTTGTWLTTTGIGIVTRWDLGSGSSFNGAAGSWSSSTFVRTSGSVNWIATNGATFYITGVQLEKGSTATSFDFRDYGRELIMCQRYYQVFGGGGGAASNQNIHALCVFPVAMRATPTLGVYSASGNCISINRPIYDIVAHNLTWYANTKGVGFGVQSGDTGMTTAMVAWVGATGMYGTAEL